MLHLFPWADYFQIINFFNLFILYQCHVKHDDRNIHFKNIQELLQIINFSLPIFMQRMRVAMLLGKYLNYKHKRKRRLIQPHMLIRIMGAYRANENTRDVWDLLIRNWNHYYWLTGYLLRL